MANFLHAFHPTPILVSLGPIQIHWYGIFIVVGMICAIAIAIKLAGYYQIKKETVIDLSFYLIIFGIIGARLYDVCLEWRYYLEYPWNVFKIWNGGLAIHGAIIAGLIVVWVFASKLASKPHPNPLLSKERGRLALAREKFWLLCSLVVPGLALALAIGRWGNYFNQEIFGYPTDLPWGIPIDFMNRPLEYISSEYFHPTFLYESVGSLVIFIILILFHFYIIKKKKFKTTFYFLLSTSYLVMYSILRFSLEFVRIDRTPVVFGLRWPQIISLFVIMVCVILLGLPKLRKRDNL
ncbi:MAG: prolipoprotein diacylglyceryl transferase [Patescibacteria group bacterium]|nr:prolipoprotein diacylglyceryl transferase [Patescibacteria group bacterium]MDD4610702.1 prolipoprotein diacylglyceryl transferase [Patescibacteria group bacterium]